jgi:enterochelin esterase-like enzyme
MPYQSLRPLAASTGGTIGRVPGRRRLAACPLLGLMSALLLGTRAHSQAPELAAGANTSDPAAPFYIDLGGLDFTTSPPTRDPRNPKYPPATELPDGALPSPGALGNFIIGPTHAPAPEAAVQDVARGHVLTFTMQSEDSVIYNPGIVRDSSVKLDATFADDPSNLIVSTSRPGTWTRTIAVYVPSRLASAAVAPLIVVGDGGGGQDAILFTVLDNLIAQGKIPAMVAVTIQAGGQDAQGSERGLEYDTVSGTYAMFVEREVLPLVERKAGVRLSHDPDARAAMGYSSSAAAAFTMAWFHPELYHRVIGYSPTMVNQQWPHGTALRGGAWEYHSLWAGPTGGPVMNAQGFGAPTEAGRPLALPLVTSSAKKPLRFWFEVGDRDLWYPLANMPDGMHDWVLANEQMARALAAKGYAYQFVFARNAGHVDRPTLAQTLGLALQWAWQGYRQPAGRH